MSAIDNDYTSSGSLALIEKTFGIGSFDTVRSIMKERFLMPYINGYSYASKSISDRTYTVAEGLEAAKEHTMNGIEKNLRNLIDTFGRKASLSYNVFNEFGGISERKSVLIDDLFNGSSVFDNVANAEFANKENNMFLHRAFSYMMFGKNIRQHFDSEEKYETFLENRNKMLSVLAQSVMPGINLQIEQERDGETGFVETRYIDWNSDSTDKNYMDSFSSLIRLIYSVIPLVDGSREKGFVRAINTDGSRAFVNESILIGLLNEAVTRIKRDKSQFTFRELLNELSDMEDLVGIPERKTIQSFILYFGDSNRYFSVRRAIAVLANKHEENWSEDEIKLVLNDLSFLKPERTNVPTRYAGMLWFLFHHNELIKGIKELQEKYPDDDFYKNVEKTLIKKNKEIRYLVSGITNMYNSVKDRVSIKHRVKPNGDVKTIKLNKVQRMHNRNSVKTNIIDWSGIESGHINEDIVRYIKKNKVRQITSILGFDPEAEGLRILTMNLTAIGDFIDNMFNIRLSNNMILKILESYKISGKEYRYESDRFRKGLVSWYKIMRVYVENKDIVEDYYKRKAEYEADPDNYPKPNSAIPDNFKLLSTLAGHAQYQDTIEFFEYNMKNNRLFIDLFDMLTNAYVDDKNVVNNTMIKDVHGNSQFTVPLSAWFYDNVFTGTESSNGSSATSSNVTRKTDIESYTPLLNKDGDNLNNVIYGGLKFESMHMYLGTEIPNLDGKNAKEMTIMDKIFVLKESLFDFDRPGWNGLSAFGDTIADKTPLPYYEFSLRNGRQMSLAIIDKNSRHVAMYHDELGELVKADMLYEAESFVRLANRWRDNKLNPNKKYYEGSQEYDFIKYNFIDRLERKSGEDSKGSYVAFPETKHFGYRKSNAEVKAMSNEEAAQYARNVHHEAYLHFIHVLREAGVFNNKEGISERELKGFEFYEDIVANKEELADDRKAIDANKTLLKNYYDNIKKIREKIDEKVKTVKEIESKETRTEREILKAKTLKEEIAKMYADIKEKEDLAKELSSESVSLYKASNELYSNLLEEFDYSLKHENGDYEWHPLLELMYWNHYLINSAINTLVRGEYDQAKDVIDYVKRAAGMNAPGLILVSDYDAPYFGGGHRVYMIEDPLMHDELYSKNNEKIEALDGDVISNPIEQAMWRKLNNGEMSPVTNASLKNVYFGYDRNQNRTTYIKANFFNITEDDYNENAHKRSAFELMLGEKILKEFEKRYQTMGYQEAIDSIADDMLASKRPGINEDLDINDMISFIAHGSAVKQGKRRVNKYKVREKDANGNEVLVDYDSEKHDFNDVVFDPTSNTKDNISILPVSGLRMQQITAQNVLNAKTSVPIQITRITSNAQIERALTYFAKKANTTLRKRPDEVLTEMIDNEILRNQEYSKSHIIMSNKDISIDTIARRIYQLIPSGISRMMRGDMPGSFHIQRASVGKVLRTDGTNRVLESGRYRYNNTSINEKGETIVDEREGIDTKTGIVKSRAALKKLLEDGKQNEVSYVPGEAIMGFTHAKIFGVKKGQSLADAMLLRSVDGDEIVSMHDEEGTGTYLDILDKVQTLYDGDALFEDDIDKLASTPEQAEKIKGFLRRNQEIQDKLDEEQKKIEEEYESVVKEYRDAIDNETLNRLYKELKIDDPTTEQKKLIKDRYAAYLYYKNNLNRRNKVDSFQAYYKKKSKSAIKEANRKKNVVDDIEKKSRQIEAAIATYFYNFNKALDIYTVRLPTTGASMGAPMRIVKFEWGSMNTISTNPKKNILDGSDYDADQMNVLYRAFREDGELVMDDSSRSLNGRFKIMQEEHLESDRHMVHQNMLFSGITGYYQHLSNYREVLDTIDLSSFRNSVESKTKTRFFNTIGSFLETHNNNALGVNMVGHGANFGSALNVLKSVAKKDAKNRRKGDKPLLDTDIFDIDKDTKQYNKFFEVNSYDVKFTNAATINANEGGLLGRMNINKATSPLIAGALFHNGISASLLAKAGVAIGMSDIDLSSFDNFRQKHSGEIGVSKKNAFLGNKPILYQILRNVYKSTNPDSVSEFRKEIIKYFDSLDNNIDGNKIASEGLFKLFSKNIKDKSFSKSVLLKYLGENSNVIKEAFEFMEMANVLGDTVANKIYNLNNSHSFQYTDNGKKSKLYAEIKDAKKDNYVKELAKYYTPTFENSYGKWLDGSGNQMAMKDDQMKMPLEQQINKFVNSKIIRELTNSISVKNNMFNRYRQGLLGRGKVFGSDAEEFDKLIATGEQLRRLNDFLKLYKGVPTSPEKIEHTIHNLERLLGMKLNKFLKEADKKTPNFPDIDEQLHYISNTLGDVMGNKKTKEERLIRSTFNMHKVLALESNLIAYIEVLNKTNKVLGTTIHAYNMKFKDGSSFIEAYKKRITAAGYSFKESDLKIMFRELERMNHIKYIESHTKVSMNRKSYDLSRIYDGEDGTLGRLSFIVDFTDYFSMLSGFSSLKNNKFISRLSKSPIDITSMKGVELLEFKRTGMFDESLSKLIAKDFSELSENAKKIFGLYQLIVYGFEYRSGSFTNVMDTTLEENYTKFMNKLYDSGEEVYTDEEKEKMLEQLAVKENIGLKKNEAAFDSFFNDSKKEEAYLEAKDNPEALYGIMQDLSVEMEEAVMDRWGRPLSNLQASALAYPDKVVKAENSGNWRVALLNSFTGLDLSKNATLGDQIYRQNPDGSIEMVTMEHLGFINMYSTKEDPYSKHVIYKELSKRNLRELDNGYPTVVKAFKGWTGISYYNNFRTKAKPHVGSVVVLDNGKKALIKREVPNGVEVIPITSKIVDGKESMIDSVPKSVET